MNTTQSESAGEPESTPSAQTQRQRVRGLHVVEQVPAADTVARPVVVLVHGSLDRASSFARVTRRLDDLHVVSYDRRGYHRSRRAGGGPDADPFLRHVSDLLEVIGGRRSVVVGHSFGGDIALAAAAESPHVIAAVGAYEAPLPWLDWWPRRSGREATEADPAIRAEAFFRRVVGDEAWERLSDQARDQRRADGPALVSELASLRRSVAPFDPSSIAVPVVLGRGGRSIPHHRRAVEVLAQLIGQSEVFEIAGASHGAHLSHPDSFSEFVRRVVATSALRQHRE